MDGEAIAGKARGAAAARPQATAVYALGRDRKESARLRQQSGEMRPYSARLLDRTGLTRGYSAIDLGCGPSGIIDLLAERVAPGGRVVGLDADPVHVAMAREFAAERGLGNVEVVEADARHTGLAPDSFDLLHGRTLLVTIPHPGEVVAEMTRLARPGGWVAGLEADAEHSLLLSGASGLGPALRDLLHGLQPKRRRSVHRPPPARAIPPGRPRRRRCRVRGPRAPGGQLTPDDPARPGAQHAPGNPGARHRRRGGTRRA